MLTVLTPAELAELEEPADEDTGRTTS